MEATSKVITDKPSHGILLRRILLALGGVVVIGVPLFTDANLLSLLTQAAVYAAVAVSLDLVWGYGGILDLGHAVWFGLGALCVGLTTTRLDSVGVVIGTDPRLLPHILGLLLGIGVVAVLAGVVGWFAFSSRGQSAFYIATLTLALAVIGGTVYIQAPQLTGGEAGLFGFAISGLSTSGAYWVALGGLVFVTGIVWVVIRSDFGVLIRAVRDGDRRVSYLGFNVPWVKIIVFVGGAVLAAIAGAVYGLTVGLVSPPMFGFLMATNIVIWVAIGGRASIFGPIIGAVAITLGSAQLNTSVPVLWQLIMGILLVIVVTFLPRGLVAPILRGWRGRAIGGDVRAERTLVPTLELEAVDVSTRHPVMSLSGFSFGYGQRKVLQNLALDFQSSELLAIIGPNGAGKSTLLTALTDGRLPHDGDVRLLPEGNEINGRPPHAIVRMGLMRKFQTPALFSTLTVAETIMLGSYQGRLPSFWRRTRNVAVTGPVLAIVEATGLDSRLNDRADQLAHGLKQGLDLAVTVVGRPKILFLDEPTAGLTPVERHVIGDILISLAHESGLSVILIEHDLDFVKRIADRVAVLARGTVVDVGSPEEVSNSVEVREVYAGEVGGASSE